MSHTEIGVASRQEVLVRMRKRLKTAEGVQEGITNMSCGRKEYKEQRTSMRT